MVVKGFTPYLMGAHTEDGETLINMQSTVSNFMLSAIGLWGYIVNHDERSPDGILRTLYSFFTIFHKESKGALCFWVWETHKNVIVKHKHLNINKEVSIRSGPRDVAQIG